MKSVSASKFKANFAKYLKFIKCGNEIGILEKGVAVAILRPINKLNITVIPPRKNPKLLSRMKFSVKTDNFLDLVEDLRGDRFKR